MRLINTRTLKLHQFSSRIPPYAILSHTWGQGEVSFQDFNSVPRRKRKIGFKKILATCREAQRQGLDYAWVDTCCIDKTSSAELGEAINSMFKWYRDSSICFAFLEDVKPTEARNDAPRAGVNFPKSRWFTRGWTLQELIAPLRMSFYNQTWEMIGDKRDVIPELEAITGVDGSVLEGGPLRQISIGKRMSWAVDRQTTRQEDIAYSLFGIFEANLPLVYGEGPRAFLRLQEEILKQTDDHTLFAWRASPSSQIQNPVRGLFASSPNEFRNFLHRPYAPLLGQSELGMQDNLVRVWDPKTPRNPIITTNKGIQITNRMKDLQPYLGSQDFLVFVLNCNIGGDPMRTAGIYLRRQDDRYARIRANELADLQSNVLHTFVDTIHCIRTEKDFHGHYFAEPWTPLSKMRKDLDDGMRLYKGVDDSIRRYNHGFYIERNLFVPISLFNNYSLLGLLIVDFDGLPRFYYDDHEQDLVLKTMQDSKAVLMISSRKDTEVILILLAMEELGGAQEYWLDAVCLTRERLRHDPALILETIKDMKRTNPPRQEISVPIHGGSLKLRITTRPVIVEGLYLRAVNLAVSYDSLLHLPFPVILIKCLNIYIIIGLLILLIISFNEPLGF